MSGIAAAVTIVLADGTLVRLASCSVCNAVVLSSVGQEDEEMNRHLQWAHSGER